MQVILRDDMDNLGKSGEHSRSFGITGIEQSQYLRCDLCWNEVALHEFARDFAARNDVDQSDVRDCHHPLREKI